MSRRVEIVLLVMALFAGLLLWLVLVATAHADDHIRPQCWDENRGGDVIRHCEVDRPDSKSPTPPPHQEVRLPPEQAPPPPPEQLPRRYAGPQYVVPMYPPSPYYGPPPPYYYGPPRAFFFRFGPFAIGF